MGKIAIVGIEGSGKTVFMAALTEYYKLGESEGRPWLIPENRAAHMFMEQVPYKLRVLNQWPPATPIGTFSVMKWSLNTAAGKIDEISLFDFPGEIFRMATDDNPENAARQLDHKHDITKFIQHLGEAELIVVLFNLADILLGDKRNEALQRRNSENSWILRNLLTAIRQIPSKPGILLALSQSDRYPTELKQADSAAALFAQMFPILAHLFPDLSVCAVSAVDKFDVNGNPAPDYTSTGIKPVLDYYEELKAAKLKEAQDLEVAEIVQWNAPIFAEIDEIVQRLQSKSQIDFKDSITRYQALVGTLKESEFAPAILQRIAAYKMRVDDLAAFDKQCDQIERANNHNSKTLCNPGAWESLVLDTPEKMNRVEERMIHYKIEADNRIFGTIMFGVITVILIILIYLGITGR